TRSLQEFIKQAWIILQPVTPFVPGWHIDALCEHLEAITYGHIRNLLINIPPRHMKSLTVSVFWPCWEWIRWPERRWLCASYAESLSLRDSRHCRLRSCRPGISATGVMFLSSPRTRTRRGASKITRP